ncbi:MAG: zinc transporter ZntB [Alphaproteobacteria bacterium]|jgi:zinc transporter|nr:zinc transporter ZntB [Alphaproteobacteria bacterium]
MTSGDDGLVCAFVLDGKGSGRALDWEGIRAWQPADGVLWVHLDREGADAQDWLRNETGIDPVSCQTLLTAEVRPRLLRLGDAALLLLRGVNLNPGANPEDMVGLRIWAEETRVITLRHRQVTAVSDLRLALADGAGPRDVGEFVAALADRMIERMAPVLDDIEDSIDGVEDAVLSEWNPELRHRLNDLRRTAISLRRYLAPQRDVAQRLPFDLPDWVDDVSRARLRETGDRLLRYVEDLDAARERAQVTQDELASAQAEQTNKHTYHLTVIAALFLPPSFIAGLLGMNVGGMPGQSAPWAFVFTLVAMALMGAVELWLLRRLKWI